ncbi:TLR4 interactor with leucine rich repeats [Syngnathus scovelli]|uniref:TLR4 interactor with leucine rich repeats n=1 Tax=Syngnathus scovelli TaxID=161590 RepID=UPI0021101F05|nr:TLR4 interactor with leucine rich repeats [Syngnathus scovelli]XP_049606533.1 TLR4 interactor with leucine rich repeats [Syngnathus scovelli]XP_049606534.1 TLR4 interactor with leucine rich repeats [Syngnathus scovelli]
MDTGYFLAGLCAVLLCLGGFASPGVCPDRCDCQQPQRLMCANRGLRSVPSPSDDQKEVLVFSLGGNFIGNISANDLGGFTGLLRLDLQFNQIQNIHPKAFENVCNLEELYVGHNRLSGIQFGTLQPLKKLTVLCVNNNDVVEITPGLLDNLDHLVKLRLDGNKIQSLQLSLFKDLRNLRYLHLESNQLHHIHRNAFSALAQLRFLNLSHNKLPALRGVTFSHLTALTTLLLSENEIQHVGNKVFHHLKKLSKLSLSNNRIAHLHSGALLGLSSLKEFLIDGNELEEIPAGLLDPLELVEHLDFSRNRLFNIDSLAFLHLKQLRFLKLRNNVLTSLPGDIFKLNNFLHNLDLHGNNWTCDCRLEELKRWMSAARSKGRLLDVFVQCHHPATLRGTSLDRVNTSHFQSAGNWSGLCGSHGGPEESQGGKTWLKMKGEVWQEESGREDPKQQKQDKTTQGKEEAGIQGDQGGTEVPGMVHSFKKNSRRSKSSTDALTKSAKIEKVSRTHPEKGISTASHDGNRQSVSTTLIPSGETFDLLRTDHKGVPPIVTDPCAFNRHFITNVSVDQVTSSTVTVHWATLGLSPDLDEVHYRIMFDRFGTSERFPRYVYATGAARSTILRELRPDVTYMVCVEGVVAGSVCQVAPRDHCSGLVTLSEDSVLTVNLQLVTVLTLAGNGVLLLVLGMVWLSRSLKKKLQRRKSAVHVRHMYSTRRPFRANLANTSASTDFTSYQSSRPARLVPPEMGDLIEFPCDRFQDSSSSRRDIDLPRFSD